MPLVMLFAMRIIDNRDSVEKGAFRVTSLVLLLILTLLALTFALVQFTAIGPVIYAASEYLSLLIMITALCCACALAYCGYQTSATGSRQVLLGLATLPLFLAYSLSLPATVIDRKAPGSFLQQFRDDVSARTVLVADGSMVHSVAWVLKREDLYMLSSGELSYGLSQPDAVDRLLDADGVARLRSSLQAGQNMLVFFRGSAAESLNQVIAHADASYQQGKFHALVFTDRH
jgi:hypothetical protein